MNCTYASHRCYGRKTNGPGRQSECERLVASSSSSIVCSSMCVCVRWVWIKTRLYPIYFRFVQFPVQLPIFVCTHTHQLGVTTIETHAARHMHEHNNASHSSNNLLIANLYSLPCTLAATTKIDHSDFEAAWTKRIKFQIHAYTNSMPKLEQRSVNFEFVKCWNVETYHEPGGWYGKICAYRHEYWFYFPNTNR